MRIAQTAIALCYLRGWFLYLLLRDFRRISPFEEDVAVAEGANVFASMALETMTAKTISDKDGMFQHK
jgi:hypothetical protein